MLGSVDGSLFQEEIENANSGISDANVCIPSKNGANDDLKFLEKFFGIGEKTNSSTALFSLPDSRALKRHILLVQIIFVFF